MAGEAAAVARKLQEAKENNILDLHNCGLLKIPDAMYMILKHTAVSSCNLSHNQILRIPTRFPENFKTLSELDLSSNTCKLSSFPEEMSLITDLQTLNISSNNFTNVPPLVYLYIKLEEFTADNNKITDISTDSLTAMSALKTVSLKQNPLPDEIKLLLKLCSVSVVLDGGDGDGDNQPA